ncbi:hypothetical protein L798_14569 [Zootermopsis nevadensis]|uniref:Uncharacterized protein n=1 Tax=Zootermopsis nevadensis TaxID=136037 RepID=A0A067QQP3_ZOONE|nr:hypothetical protein L798_14569 [Zootermopsis nevadensis]
MYHTECPVIRWLAKHCRFIYDRTEQCLTPKSSKYVTAEKRRLIDEILQAHAQLKRDIVKTTDTETIIWKRHEDGRLTRIPVRSQRESEVVGSFAWRIVGEVTPRK